MKSDESRLHLSDDIGQDQKPVVIDYGIGDAPNANSNRSSHWLGVTSASLAAAGFVTVVYVLNTVSGLLLAAGLMAAVVFFLVGTGAGFCGMDAPRPSRWASAGLVCNIVFFVAMIVLYAFLSNYR